MSLVPDLVHNSNNNIMSQQQQLRLDPGRAAREKEKDAFLWCILLYTHCSRLLFGVTCFSFQGMGIAAAENHKV